MARLWAFVALIALTGPALAQEVDCTDPQAQVELTFCAEQDWIAADADLNAEYKRAMAQMKLVYAGLESADQGAAAFLKQAQRDWVAFRDNACAAEAYPLHGGSAEPMVIYACRARLTVERTEGLTFITAMTGE